MSLGVKSDYKQRFYLSFAQFRFSYIIGVAAEITCAKLLTFQSPADLFRILITALYHFMKIFILKGIFSN